MVSLIFQNSPQKINSGVKNISNKSVSEIWFQTPSRDVVHHYVFIFRRGGGLETEFKNTIQYNLGTKIYLDN